MNEMESLGNNLCVFIFDKSFQHYVCMVVGFFLCASVYVWCIQACVQMYGPRVHMWRPEGNVGCPLSTACFFEAVSHAEPGAAVFSQTG